MPEGGYFFNFDKLAYVRGRHPAACILCLARDGSPDVVDLSIWRDDLFIASVNLYPYNPGSPVDLPAAARRGHSGADR